MKPVVIVGAGFSGLTLAYCLTELGVPVRVLEKTERPGGLIGTRQTTYGLVESAANALIVNAEIEKLFAQLSVEFAQPVRESKNRYIFWQKPSRWPIGLVGTLRLILFVLRLKLLGAEQVAPQPGETVQEWALRLVGAQVDERLISPALQGVYASKSSSLSASLIIKRFLFGPFAKRGVHRGSAAPLQGMGDLIAKLTEHLGKKNVAIEFGQDFTLPASGQLDHPVVLCTSAWAAAQIATSYNPQLAALLRRCKSLPLVSVTAFFRPAAQELKGFGCLFPQKEGFNALGVLFGSSIFSNRSSQRVETWILGGEDHANICTLSDAQILEMVLSDRKRFSQDRTAQPLEYFVTRWPQSIPVYSVEWEATLAGLNNQAPLYLHGNYLGQLGLAQIYQRSQVLAAQIKENYV